MDIAIFAAAVADWRDGFARHAARSRSARGASAPKLELVENPDILKTVAKRGPLRPPLVMSFAAETEAVVEHAIEKRKAKGADWIVANDVSSARGVFGGDANAVHLVTGAGVEAWPPMSKAEVAEALMVRAAEHLIDTQIAVKGRHPMLEGTIKVRVVRLAHARGLGLPAYQSEAAAGLDLAAAVDRKEPMVLKPGERALVPTGLVLELPPDTRASAAAVGSCVQARRHRAQQPGHDRQRLSRRSRSPSDQPRPGSARDPPRRADRPARGGAGLSCNTRRGSSIVLDRAGIRRLRLDADEDQACGEENVSESLGQETVICLMWRIRVFGFDARLSWEISSLWAGLWAAAKIMQHAGAECIQSQLIRNQSQRPSPMNDASEIKTLKATKGWGRGKVFNDITETIGHTPLVRLAKIGKQAGVRADILIKLEFFNPLSSVKDRIGVVDDRRRSRRRARSCPARRCWSSRPRATQASASPSSPRRGATSSCWSMPESMSIERRKILAHLGAELVLTPAAGGMPSAIDKANQLLASLPDAVQPSQFENPANPLVHEKTTAEEIWNDTQGNVDALVIGVGTGGTLTGCGRVLKPRKPSLKVYAVEPEGSPVLSGGARGHTRFRASAQASCLPCSIPS